MYIKACLNVVAVLALCFGAAAQDTLAGVASVKDGDTIFIHSEEIRLGGFDSPEVGKLCGNVNVYQAAALALSDLIGTQTVECSLTGKDRHGRHVGTCYVRGKELGEHMVSEGWARDWPRFSKRAYADEERIARDAGAGIWGLECPAELWGNRNYD
jgi:endonuclease YncB( thermonuclease family)